MTNTTVTPEFNQECTYRCRSTAHAERVWSSITSNISCDRIKLYLLLLCRTFWKARCQPGTAVLAASSTGRADLLDWLLGYWSSDGSIRDAESSYTPMHRALLYGQITCVQVLIDYDLSFRGADNEGLLPLQIPALDKAVFMRQSIKICEPDADSVLHKESVSATLVTEKRQKYRQCIYTVSDPTEVYTWGTNESFNLGHSRVTARQQPDVLDYFRRLEISIVNVCMSKYHTLFLASDGRVYSCGHGVGGRLGHADDQQSQPTPKLVQDLPGPFETKCVAIACGPDHTLFLMDNGQTLSCGSNRYGQLGHGDSYPLSLKPLPLCLPKSHSVKIVGVSAAQYHSVIWSDNAVFVCGLNAGQMGFPKTESGDAKIWQVKSVTSVLHSGFEVVDISCSDGATAIVSRRGDVLMLYQYQTRKIMSRQHELKSVHLFGGTPDVANLTGEISSQELRIVVLTFSGKLFYWSESHPNAVRCVADGVNARTIYPSDICFSSSHCTLVTTDGLAFRATFTQRKPACNTDKSTNSLLNKSECQPVVLRPIPFIYRAIRAFCSPDGRNNCVLQQSPHSHITDIPMVVDSTMLLDFSVLLGSDSVVPFDLTLKCPPPYLSSISAHRFIVASRSSFVASRMNQDSEQELELPCSLPQELLVELLAYIYLDWCVLLPKQRDRLTNEERMRLAFILPERHLSESEPNKRSKATKKKTSGAAQSTDLPSSHPISQLKIAAQQLGVKSLVRKLDNVTVDARGQPCLKRHCSVAPPRLRFDPLAHSGLADLRMQCNDSKEPLFAHRCVLASRLQFFTSMLDMGVQWAEHSRSDQTIALPDTSETVLRDILHYAYVDDLPSSLSAVPYDAERVQRVCRLLVQADKMLIERLRSLCEVLLSRMITLRNCSEILDFAAAFNATQLRDTCLQFISFNLSPVLEANSLALLQREQLDQLTQYYRRTFPSVGSRVITPEPKFVNEILETCEVFRSRYPELTVDDVTDIFLDRYKTECGSDSGSTSRAATRRRNTKQRRGSLAQLSTTTSVKQADTCPAGGGDTDVPAESDRPKMGLRLEDSNTTSEPKPPPTASEVRQHVAEVGLRLSAINSIVEAGPVAAPVRRPWHLSPPSSPSAEFVDLRSVMQQQEATVRKSLPSSTSPSTPRSKKTWKALPPVAPSETSAAVYGSSPAAAVYGSSPDASFSEILMEQQLAEVVARDQTQKSIAVIQAEERAIAELKCIYNADDNFDEYIVVERVAPTVASPLWKANIKLAR